MTMFNPKGNIQPTAEEWASIALKSSDSDGLQWVTIGGILGTLAVWAIGGIPLAVITGAGVIFYSFSQINKSGKHQEGIQRFGCVAHALDDSDFLSFRMQVGEEEVAKQLLFAQSHGFPIKRPALDFLVNYGGLEINSEEVKCSAVSPTDLIQSPTTITESVSRKTELIPDIAREIAMRLKPTLVVGVPGAGKDILIWNAAEIIKQDKSKKVFIFAIDPKADPNEKPYFEGRVDKLFTLDFNSSEPADCFKFVQEALQYFEDFDAGDGYKILVFNELNAVTKVLKSVTGGMLWLEKKLTFYSSSGRSRKWILWAVSQTAHEKGLGFGGETRPIFIKIVLITLDNPDAAVDILRAQIIAKEQKLPPQELKKLCDRSPVGVAVYHGSLQKWFPQVKMRDFIGEAKSSQLIS